MFDLQSDAKTELLEMLGMDGTENRTMELLDKGGSRWLKDAKVNLKNVLASEHLDEKETALLALAVAVNERHEALKIYFSGLSSEKGATEAEIADAVACASLLAANNVTYRFRHFANKDKYNNSPMRIKMNIMMKPAMGKEFFELMSLAISAVNGCEMCVNAHERSLLQLESTEERIWDSVRLAGVVVSLSKLV